MSILRGGGFDCGFWFFRSCVNAGYFLTGFIIVSGFGRLLFWCWLLALPGILAHLEIVFLIVVGLILLAWCCASFYGIRWWCDCLCFCSCILIFLILMNKDIYPLLPLKEEHRYDIKRSNKNMHDKYDQSKHEKIKNWTQAKEYIHIW